MFRRQKYKFGIPFASFNSKEFDFQVRLDPFGKHKPIVPLGLLGVFGEGRFWKNDDFPHSSLMYAKRFGFFGNNTWVDSGS